MTEGQNKLLHLFKEVKTICDKNNIRYYIAGGTLIGALRHRGFIPWDDDLDVYMTRDEFNKFADLARNGALPEGRALECQELNRNYKNIFGRYTDTTTCAIHKNQLTETNIAGEVLDIIQLDPVPDDPKLRWEYYELMGIYGDLINEYASYSTRYEPSYQKFSDYLSLSKQIGKVAVLRMIEEKLFCYPEDECTTYIMRLPGQPLVFQKKIFEPALEVQFEDVTVTMPHDFNQYLIDHYGEDWMYVPNVSGQDMHDALRSYRHSYQMVQASYWDFIEPDAIRKSMAERKDSMVRNIVLMHSVSNTVVRLRGEKVRLEVLRRIEREGLDLMQLLRDHKYKKLNSLFKTYFSLQNSPQFSGRDNFRFYYRFLNPILIDLPLDVLYPALVTLNCIGRSKVAYRIIEIFAQEKGCLPEQLLELKQLLQLQREAINASSFGNYNRCLELTEKVLSVEPYSLISIKIRIRSLLDSQGDSDEITDLLKRGRHVAKEDGELQKYEADLLYPRNPRKAVGKYLAARETTANGFIWMEIDQRLEEYAASLKQQLKQALEGLRYEEGKRLFDELVSLKQDDPGTTAFYISELLRAGARVETPDSLYRISRKLLGRGPEMEELIRAVLIHNAEPPVVAEFILMKSRISGGLSDTTWQDMEDKISSELAGIPETERFVRLELRAVLGMVMEHEEKTREAYQLYREVYPELRLGRILQTEIMARFEDALSSVERFREAGVDPADIAINFAIKFEDLDTVYRLFDPAFAARAEAVIEPIGSGGESI